MNITRMTCPSCGGQLKLPQELTRVTCTYCDTELVLEVGEGYSALRIAEEVSSSIREVGTETTKAIRDSSDVTREELRRIQVTQEIAALQAQLSSTQSEIRTLERGRKKRKAKRQLKELRRNERTISSRITSLQASIARNASSTAESPTATAPAKDSKWNDRRGCMASIAVYFAFAFCVATLTASSEDFTESTTFTVLNVIVLAIAVSSFFYFRIRSNTLARLVQSGASLLRPKKAIDDKNEPLTNQPDSDSA